MKWKKFTLTTTTEAVDLVSSLFDEIGIQGIEIEDNIPLTESETKARAAARRRDCQGQFLSGGFIRGRTDFKRGLGRTGRIKQFCGFRP